MRVSGRDRPRIVLLSNYPADHVTFTGGVESATVALLEGLRAHQGEFEFHIIGVPGCVAADRREQRDGFQFHLLGLPGRRWVRPRLPVRVAATYAELRRVRPDLVHCQDNMSLALAAILSGYRRIFTAHGIKRHEAKQRTGWERWSAQADTVLEHFVHRHFNSFVAISDYTVDVLGAGQSAVLIPNAVRNLFFETPVCPAQPPYLLFVGVLAPLKRPADLLAAHARLRAEFPTLETLVCGSVEDAEYAANLHRTVAEQRIGGICFLGQTDQHRLAQLLAGATALVLPSAQENAPMVVAEAMAVGVPVVASRVGGLASMVQHGETGYLFRSGSVPELTQYVRQLLRDAPLRERLGQAARAYAQQQYRPARVAEATIELYKQLLHNPPLRRTYA